MAQGQLEAYLDLCADLGITRIECGEGFTELPHKPRTIVQMAHERELEVQYEMGKKHEGPFTEESLDEAIARGHAWLDAGAVQLVVEARESAKGVGMFGNDGSLNTAYADRFAEEFGLDIAMFEAPNKPSQFMLRIVGALKPGTALDVAMGQGRNSLYLAGKGWDVTGYDLSPKGPFTDGIGGCVRPRGGPYGTDSIRC